MKYWPPLLCFQRLVIQVCMSFPLCSRLWPLMSRRKGYDYCGTKAAPERVCFPLQPFCAAGRWMIQRCKWRHQSAQGTCLSEIDLSSAGMYMQSRQYLLHVRTISWTRRAVRNRCATSSYSSMSSGYVSTHDLVVHYCHSYHPSSGSAFYARLCRSVLPRFDETMTINDDEKRPKLRRNVVRRWHCATTATDVCVALVCAPPWLWQRTELAACLPCRVALAVSSSYRCDHECTNHHYSIEESSFSIEESSFML